MSKDFQTDIQEIALDIITVDEIRDDIPAYDPGPMALPGLDDLNALPPITLSRSQSFMDIVSGVPLPGNLSISASLHAPTPSSIPPTTTSPKTNASNAVIDVAVTEPLAKGDAVLLFVIFLAVFLDELGFSIVMPIMPFYAEAFNASASELGTLYTAYNAMLLVGTFIMGTMADRFGRKPMIILSLLGTTIGFLFSGLAQDYIQLLLSRIFNGCASCTRPVVAACVADVVPEEKVPKFMSIMGAFIGFSYLFGPVMGGVLAEFGGMRCPFYAATAVSAVGFVLSLIFVRETNPIVLEKRFKSKAKDSKPSDIDKPSQSEGKVEAIDPVQSSADGQTEIAKESDRIPIEVWILCALYFSACMGWTLYIAVFYLFMIETYAFDTLGISCIAVAVTVMCIFNVTILFNVLSSRVGLYRTTVIAECCFAASSLAIPFIVMHSPFAVSKWTVIVVIIIGYGCGFGLLEPAMVSMSSEFANERNRGLILSIALNAKNTAYMFGPMAMGYLYELDPIFPFYGAAAFHILALFLMIGMLLKWPHLIRPTVPSN